MANNNFEPSSSSGKSPKFTFGSLFEQLFYVLLTLAETRMDKLSQLAQKPTSVGGIHFAPIHVPLQRRWQTLAVAFWVFMLFAAPFLCLILPLYILFATSYWWLVLAYCAWFVFTCYARILRKLR